MDQMINNSYAQQYPNSPQFAQTQQTYPSPMTPHTITSSPTSYRAAPYPSPHAANFKQTHGRAYSMASPADLKHNPQPQSISVPPNPERRMSTPSSLPTAGKSTSPLKVEDINPDPDHQRQTQSAVVAPSGTFNHASFPPLWQDHGPFTTALAPEAQQMLAPALDPNDPFSAMLMAGSEHLPYAQFNPWMQSTYSKSNPMLSSMHSNYNGMSATLAPSALDNSHESLSAATSSTGPQAADGLSVPSAGLDFNFSQDSTTFKGLSGGLTRESSSHDLASGQITPGGEGFWDAYVQEPAWGEESVAG